MLKYKYITTPSSEDFGKIKKFYKSLDSVTIEQYPQWENIIMDNGRFTYFVAEKDDEIVCFAKVREYKISIFSYAHIQCGPLFRDSDNLIESLCELYAYYKTKGVIKLDVLLGIETGKIASYIEYKLAKYINYSVSNIIGNWSSIRLELKTDEDVIFRNFSKGHKSDIKKALKLGIKISSEDLSEQDLRYFYEDYSLMASQRGLGHIEEERDFFISLKHFFDKEQNGKFYLVKDEMNTIIGGIIVVYQGDTVRYYKGAANPKFRHIPILHIALWEAVKDAKLRGFKYFDFWGYNHWVNEDNQIFFINRFKKGFGGEYVFYPKTISFVYHPFMLAFYKSLKTVKYKFVNNRLL